MKWRITVTLCPEGHRCVCTESIESKMVGKLGLQVFSPPLLRSKQRAEQQHVSIRHTSLVSSRPATLDGGGLEGEKMERAMCG